MMAAGTHSHDYVLPKRWFWILAFAVYGQQQLVAQDNNFPQAKISLIYFNAEGLHEVHKRIGLEDKYYTEALQELKERADQLMTFDPDPVVNKTKIPPSGDKHDYLSLGPYWWPDTTQVDGLPWIRRDGEVNPQTRGNHTDKLRLSRMFDAITHLSWAYFYSEESKYGLKAIDVLTTWFVDSSTRVNPNVNFGQGVPGRSVGRPFGIIEWRGVADIVTAIQFLHHGGLLQSQTKTSLDKWLSDYTDWLLYSELGQEEGSRANNHASWYDYSVIGLLTYLGRVDEAKAKAEAAKISRIAAQVMPDGSQPEELERTKSLSYSTMNLRALVLVAHLAKSLDVNLLHHVSSDGSSLSRAAEFLAPYVKNSKKWEHQQIGKSPNLVAQFSLLSTVFGKPLLAESIDLQSGLEPLQRLRYPPLLFENN